MAMGLGMHSKITPFLRSVSILSSGTALSLAVPILAAPLLGRLYSPADYGALAQYMAFSAILAVPATLQFHNAIIAEGSLRAARQIVWLCLCSAAGVSILVLSGVALAWPLGLSETAAGSWIWMLPASVLVAGVGTCGTFMANRMGRYRYMAWIPLLNTLATVTLSITLGFSGWGRAGLLSAYFAGQIIQALAFGIFLREADLGPVPAPALLWRRARRHWRFPAVTMPSEVAGQINMQVPIFALTAIGAHSAVGAFARARQLVSLPVTAIGGAVAQVFRRDASLQYRAGGNCRPLMLRTAGGLLAAGIGPCVLLILLAPRLFEIYLGPNWREAGELARIMAPMLLLRVVVSPLTTVFYFTENQVLDLWLMLLSTAAMALFVGGAWLWFGSAVSIVTGFSLGYGLVYVIYFVTCFGVGKK